MTQNNEAKILTPEQIENNKQQIIDIYRNCVKREGSDKLLDYLINKSDFFTAPASTRFHGAYDGGLASALCDNGHGPHKRRLSALL